MATSETEAAREGSAHGGAAGEGHGGSGDGGESHGAAHASNRFYLIIAAVLAVLTALEVMVFYVPALDAVLVPILMVMMIAKFALVVMFFMHLKYDSAILTGLFVGPLIIAVAIIVAMMALFGQFA